MSDNQESKIRDRAYALWENDGSPEGRDQEYWHRAERELAEETGADSSEQPATITQPPLPAGTLAR